MITSGLTIGIAVLASTNDASIFQLTNIFVGSLIGPVCALFFVGMLFPRVDTLVRLLTITSSHFVVAREVRYVENIRLRTN